MENWLPVPDYEGLYEVSDQGNVRACAKDARGAHGSTRRLPARPRSLTKQRSGHLTVDLYRDNRRRTYLVHRLVLAAFVGPCPEGEEGLHYNDVPDDNRLPNLRWGTRSDNVRDALRNGGVVRPDVCKRGHHLSGDNVSVYNGSRHCVTCNRDRSAAFYAARKKD